MSYRAPVSDMLSTMRNVAGLDRLIADGLAPELEGGVAEAVLDEAAKFANDVIAPLNRVGDLTGSKLKDGAVTTPPGWKEAYKAWAEAGWNALPAPEAYGGQGLPALLQSACIEMWNSAAFAFALGPLLTVGAIEAIHAHGSDHLKETYLAKLVSGEWMGTMNLTEPQAGSDLNALRSKAERLSDGTYRITGQKIFITYGEHDLTENIIHLVLARLPDAPPGTRGISLFLVPKFMVNADGSLGAHNDLRCSGIEHKLGIHASPTCSMAFGDNDGAIGWLIGEENRGLACMFTMMNNARLNVALQGVAIAERAYQQALAFAHERKQGAALDAPKGAADEPDHRPSGRAPHADGHARQDARRPPPSPIRSRKRSTARIARPTRPGARRRPSAPRSSPPSPRPMPPISVSTSPRPACRSMAAWASSRRPAPPSICAMPVSPRSTRAPTASRRSISLPASCRCPAVMPCMP